MVSTLLVIGGVLVGLLVLLALIVHLSARPEPGRRPGASSTARNRAVDQDRPGADAWAAEVTSGTSEIPAIR